MMYGSTDASYEVEGNFLLITMNLYIDDRIFSGVIKMDRWIAVAWVYNNLIAKPYGLLQMFEAEVRRLHMNVNIQPYWNDNFIREVWFVQMITDYQGFYNDASVTISPHGWELTISPEKTQEFLETVQSIYEHAPHPTPPFNATEVLAFIEKGDSI